MRQSPYYPALTGNPDEQIKCFGRSKQPVSPLC